MNYDEKKKLDFFFVYVRTFCTFKTKIIYDVTPKDTFIFFNDFFYSLTLLSSASHFIPIFLTELHNRGLVLKGVLVAN